MSFAHWVKNDKENGATIEITPLITLDTNNRSGRSPPEPYPDVGTMIINYFIIGDTAIYTKV